MRENSRVKNEALIQNIDALMQRARDMGHNLTDRGVSLAATGKADTIRNIRRGWEPKPSTLRKLEPALFATYAELVAPDMPGERRSPGMGETGQIYTAGAAVALTGVTRDFRPFLQSLAEKLGRNSDPELTRLMAIFMTLFDEQLATGQPFNARAFVIRLARWEQTYHFAAPATAATAPAAKSRKAR